MTYTTYTYDKSVVNLDRLAQEITDSTISTKLSYTTYSNNVLSIVFCAVLTYTDELLLNEIVAAHTGEALEEDTSTEVTVVGGTITTEKPEGSSSTLCSHNFCDKTTWYTNSVSVTSEVLTTSDNLTYKSVNTYWVDLTHGKVPYEDRISKPVVVYIDGVIVTRGYTVDYISGSVTFAVAQTGVVTVSYWYATDSVWTITPISGKYIKVLVTIVKFSEDVVMQEEQHIMFQTFAGTTPVTLATIYKNFSDLRTCCDKVETDDGYKYYHFDYITVKALASSSNLSIRIWIKNHEQVTGTYGVVMAQIMSFTE